MLKYQAGYLEEELLLTPLHLLHKVETTVHVAKYSGQWVEPSALC
jgi:hypothetical protein